MKALLYISFLVLASFTVFAEDNTEDLLSKFLDPDNELVTPDYPALAEMDKDDLERTIVESSFASLEAERSANSAKRTLEKAMAAVAEAQKAYDVAMADKRTFDETEDRARRELESRSLKRKAARLKSEAGAGWSLLKMKLSDVFGSDDETVAQD